jgi:hypothetical protein
MAHELINASGQLYKPGNGATGFYAREPMPLDHLANSVKTFLGLSIECAQCHDHPFDDWTQKDFYKLAAFSSKTHLRVDPTTDVEKKTFARDRKILKNKSFDEWIFYRESLRVKYAAIYGNGTGFMRLPHDYQYEDGKPFEAMEADVLFGKMPPVDHKLTKAKLDSLNHHNFGPQINSRKSLADWMVSPDNPMFTKSVVNRLWHQVMGTELAVELSREPTPDDFVDGQIPACVSRVIPVIELHHFVMRSEQPSAGELIANNAIHGGIVVGRGVDAGEIKLSESEPSLAIYSDDQLLEGCAGPSLIQTINSSVKWLTEIVRERGDRLSAGQIILTGSIPSLIPIEADCHLRIEAPPFGDAEATIVN